MEILVHIAMFGCLGLFLALFAFLPARRAVVVGFIGAWLFLPIRTYEVVGIPDYTKLFATCIGVFLGVIVFDFRRLLSFRPAWVDIPMIIWCAVPLAASITNADGLQSNPIYDGLSEGLGQSIMWGAPYLLGRLYFNDWDGLKELALGIVISGFIYVPLLLFEMRFSPQLHRVVYGYHQHAFEQTIRFGGFRPMVFMHHGLMVAFWVMAVSLTAMWLWYTGAVKKVGPIPFGIIAGALVILTIMLRSVNAWVWISIGLFALFTTAKLRTSWIVVALMLLVPIYTFTQASSIFPNEQAVRFATGVIGPERAQSLEFRFYNEDFLTAKAREQPVFGWAGWDRQHVFFEWGPRTIADSLWVIVFGKFGAVGLAALVASLLGPGLVFLYRYPPWLWSHPRLAPAAVLSVILMLYMYDGLLNAMINPIFMLAAGGIMGVCAYAAVPFTDDPEDVLPEQFDGVPALGD